MEHRRDTLASVMSLDPKETQGRVLGQRADRSPQGPSHTVWKSDLMLEEELGPKSLESEASYLVNSQVCAPNTRSTLLGAHPRSCPPQGSPPQPCGLGWKSEEGEAHLGYRQRASQTVEDAAGNP